MEPSDLDEAIILLARAEALLDTEVGGTLPDVTKCFDLSHDIKRFLERLSNWPSIPQPGEPTMDLLHPEVRSVGEVFRGWCRKIAGFD